LTSFSSIIFFHRFDVGCVLAQKKLAIPPACMRQELSHKLAEIGAELIMEVLRDLNHFEAKKWEQNEEGVTQGKKVLFYKQI